MSCTEHIGKLTDLFCVFDRLIEGIAEIVRNKNCKVCIVTLKILITVSVNNSKVVILILLTYKAARVLTEGTNLIFKRLRITDEL